MPGLLRGVARTAVISGTATAVSNRVSRRQAGRWAQQGEEHSARQTSAEQTPAQQTSSTAPPAAAPMDTKISQLHQLGQLRDQGVLTEEEFEAQKRRILEF
ncbi:SHOCT domain-containing protein [Streptomyces sp. NPDC058700]|uniref:SHOCT domain-containing protein n=1 Tax=Streptomyces sp. NPDC058700 TaxID=3346607 RepID=UPI003648E04B